MNPVRALAVRLRPGDSYELVLALLLAAVAAGILAPDGTGGSLLRDGIYATAVVVAYWTATARRAFLVPRVVLPSLALVVVVLGAFEGATTDAAAAAIGVALSAWLAVLIVRDMFERARIDLETIFGVLSLYVVLGLLFASLIGLAAELGDDSFYVRGDDGDQGEHLYFSFVALTTTGFGDLSPAGSVGKSLAVLEIVVGQFYVVTVVALIVTAAAGRTLLGREGVDRR